MAGREYERGYSDNSTSNFQKMGDEPLTSHLVNISGDRSPYTTPIAKKGPSGDSESERAAVRGHTEIHEAHGPKFRPQTTVCFPNAPEHAQTQRAVRQVPSAVGNRDFWSARGEDNGGKVLID